MTPDEQTKHNRRLLSLQHKAEQAIIESHLQELGCSWLRKRFQIDYTTAVHLMDKLEAAGDIAPASDLPLRTVLMPAAGFSIFD
jgi:DNA segregation ATPase FtsK/SpoIIIE-like protein